MNAMKCQPKKKQIPPIVKPPSNPDKRNQISRLVAGSVNMPFHNLTKMLLEVVFSLLSLFIVAMVMHPKVVLDK